MGFKDFGPNGPGAAPEAMEDVRSHRPFGDEKFHKIDQASDDDAREKDEQEHDIERLLRLEGLPSTGEEDHDEEEQPAGHDEEGEDMQEQYRVEEHAGDEERRDADGGQDEKRKPEGFPLEESLEDAHVTHPPSVPCCRP